MNPGIYHVTFASLLHRDQADGLAIVKGNTINGGDMGYIYRGSFELKNGRLAATLNIKRWNQYAVSIFGNIAEFDLVVEGQVSVGQTSFSGHAYVMQNPQMQLTFAATKVGDAA